jgi:biopolymer transport protein ExbD
MLHLDLGTNEINMSPLIDMIFILLIFFLVASVFVEVPNEKVNPVKTVSQKVLDSNSIILAITEKNEVIYGSDTIPLDQVRSLLDRLLKKKKFPVMLQVDEMSDAHVLAQVINQSKIAGVEVFIATSVE